MLKIDKNNNPVNPCHLDSSLVILKHLSGWKNFIWSCWGIDPICIIATIWLVVECPFF